MKIYYKVVSDKMTSAVSCRGLWQDCRPIVRYELGKWIEAPRNTRLFLFEELDHAKYFRWYNNCEKIFECQAIGVIRGFPGKKIHETKIFLDNFWNQVSSYLEKKKKVDWNSINCDKSLPVILARKVKLIKEIV